MKTREIVSLAHRKLGIQAATRPLTGEQMADGVTALNLMLHSFKTRGVDLAHVDLEADDDFTMPPEFREGVVYLLAERLSPDYMIPPTFNAKDWWRGIQAYYFDRMEVDMPQELVRMPSYPRRAYRA